MHVPDDPHLLDGDQAAALRLLEHLVQPRQEGVALRLGVGDLDDQGLVAG